MKMFSSLSVLLLLSMLAVPFQATADDFERGDVNLDGNVSISDVTCLIDYLLSNQWPEEQPKPENVTFVLNGIEINMVYVEGGTFTMGASGTDTEAYDNEFPAHIVTLSSYYICTTEVTQQLWRAVMGSNPSNHISDVLCPVEKVSWDDCQTFISKLNQMTGADFRLPTEAEWEFAARGGNESNGYKYAGSNNVNEVAWFWNTTPGASNMTRPVASKLPNELGLYDMSGNVYEWCSDRYGNYSVTDESINPQGPTSGTTRVYRGGSYQGGSVFCRVSYRNSGLAAYNWIGLRLAMSYPN